MSKSEEEVFVVFRKDDIENKLFSRNVNKYKDSKIKKLITSRNYKVLETNARQSMKQMKVAELKKSEFDKFIKDYMGKDNYEEAKRKAAAEAEAQRED